jgi:nitrite reductase/ring-hydroxylating ferredoxin subunit
VLVQPSLGALACDLVGEDWTANLASARPTVAEAIRACPRGQVMAARDSSPGGPGAHEVAVCVMEDGRAFVLPDRCPHDGGLLSDGFVEAGRLVCARHGWEFDPATGARSWPPCPAREGQ